MRVFIDEDLIFLAQIGSMTYIAQPLQVSGSVAEAEAEAEVEAEVEAEAEAEAEVVSQ